MAYTRWSSDSNWYIFYECTSSNKKEEQLIAIWHSDDPSNRCSYTYSEISEIYKNNNWNKLKTNKLDQIDILKECVQSFIQDVDCDYANNIIYDNIDSIPLDIIAEKFQKEFNKTKFTYRNIMHWLVCKNGISHDIVDKIISVFESLDMLTYKDGEYSKLR